MYKNHNVQFTFEKITDQLHVIHNDLYSVLILNIVKHIMSRYDLAKQLYSNDGKPMLKNKPSFIKNFIDYKFEPRGVIKISDDAPIDVVKDAKMLEIYGDIHPFKDTFIHYRTAKNIQKVLANDGITMEVRLKA